MTADEEATFIRAAFVQHLAWLRAAERNAAATTARRTVQRLLNDTLIELTSYGVDRV